MNDQRQHYRSLRRRQPTGMTLVELLTVVAIIGVLVALLLPAVQAARESARRTTCQNHLQQNALAVLQHVDTHHGELPALWRTSRKEPWQNFPWRVDILDELDQRDVADRLNLANEPLDKTNVDFLGRPLPTIECPSTPDSPRLLTQMGSAPLGRAGSTALAAGDYAAVFDVETSPVQGTLSGAWRSPAASSGGVLGGKDKASAAALGPQRRAVPNQLRTITDGLSKTILLAEQAGKPTPYPVPTKSNDNTISEGAWGTAELASYSAAGVNRDNSTGPYGFHSGANVALCDGSVVLLADDIEAVVLSTMLSRDGQEIIDARDWQTSQ